MPRIINFEGRRITVPDDASDQEIEGILSGSDAAQPQGMSNVDYTSAMQDMSAMSTPPITQPQGNGGLYVAQQANRGLADVVGAPVDLASAGINLGLAGADKLAGLFGGGVDARISEPVFGSDWIANRAADVNQAVTGNAPVQADDVSGTARLLGAGARGATSAAAGAMGLASAPAQVAGQGSRLLGGLTQPYASGAGATIARDAIAGAGAGIGAQSYDEFAPQAVQDSSFSPIAKTLAALMGGVGAAGLSSVAEGTVKGIGNLGRNIIQGSEDAASPINPTTGQRYTRTEMDQAARVAQNMPTNRAQALANIDEGAQDFAQFANKSETPTTGMLADDIGMSIQENVLRARDPQRFVERDTARRSLASDRLDASTPRGAEGRNFTNEATRQYDDTLNAARQQVDDVTGRQATAQADLARQNADLGEFRTRQPETSAKLAQEFNTQHSAAQAQKNALYNSVDDATPVAGQELYDDLAAVRESVPRAAQSGTDYATVNNRLDGLLRQVNPETGEATIRDLTYGDLKILRADVNAARKEAVAAGRDVTYLDRVGNVLSQRIDEINPEAAANYRENFAPRFRTGRAGEYVNQTKAAARTGNESSATRPSEFGGKFLSKPEDAAALQRAVDVNGNPVTAQNATEWMLGDLAKSGVLTDKADLRFDKFKQWADRNKGVIDQFPAVRERVDQELARAQSGSKLSKELADEVNAARANLRTTEDQLRRSALQNAVGNSPENAVAGIMGSGDPEKRMAEMVDKLKGNKDATDGLKAATRDWIKNKAGTTAANVGEGDTVRLSRAKLDTLFKQHEKTLAKIYTPEEMNSLRQAHKLLDVEKRLDVKSTAGSDTFNKFMADKGAREAQLNRALEAGLKGYFGVLKGGGVYRTIKLALSSLPDGTKGVSDILFEMQFNPELAKHLLTRDVKDIGSPAWNGKLLKLLAIDRGAQENVEAK
ncbi:MAG: hypothetical protein IH622_13710 [Ochrobactrum anthropi]|uniref:Uncharacterized protein n=1 Tax=Brucella anthropi TaxID=529 RepID=A0A8I0T9N8_BRUAN|nr:hypothetical protein [Brucella anthropi]MBE0561854.1 hypothetical protein [Brucella anthropi]